MSLPRDVGLVLLGAGAGLRAGGGTPKQFREVAGVPLLLRSLRPFAPHPWLSAVVITLPLDVLDAPPVWLAELETQRLRLVAGGATRADSVRAALAALPPDCTTVVVHDGARPFPSRGVIDAVVASARAGQAAIAAIPVTDTIKVGKPGPEGGVVIARTIPRDALWRAATPQAFPRAVLERAHRLPTIDPSGATDDAMLVEALDVPVQLIAEEPTNIKVTSPGDFLLAEAIATLGSSW